VACQRTMLPTLSREYAGVLDKPVQHDKTLCKDATFVTVGIGSFTGPLRGREYQTQEDPPS
jgi:hypothetical protein